MEGNVLILPTASERHTSDARLLARVLLQMGWEGGFVHGW